MEPFDIDKIIREKLQENSGLHKQQMDSARPFVWGSVQQKIAVQGSITWHHLAAAVVFLLIAFSVLLYGIQQMHNQKIDQLTNKLDQIQQSRAVQVETLRTKETRAESLENKLRQVELLLVDLQQQSSEVKEVIVYRTDTVYVKQVEYITVAADSTQPKELIADVVKKPLEKEEEATELQEVKTDDVIFLSSSSQSKDQPSEAIKFKFGAFSREK